MNGKQLKHTQQPPNKARVTLAPVEEPVKKLQPKKEEKPKPKRWQRLSTILVVDDIPQFREQIAGYISSMLVKKGEEDGTIYLVSSNQYSGQLLEILQRKGVNCIMVHDSSEVDGLVPKYSVSTAVDGLDALHVMQREGYPDLVITDNDMPNMMGVALVRNIREEEEREKKTGIPIIMITAGTDLSVANAIDSCGTGIYGISHTPSMDGVDIFVNNITADRILNRILDDIEEAEKIYNRRLSATCVFDEHAGRYWSLSMPPYTGYVPPVSSPPSQIELISSSQGLHPQVGGKSKGIFYIAQALDLGIPIASEYSINDSITIRVPPMGIITTDFFELFMKENDLLKCVTQMPSYEQLEPALVRERIEPDIIARLRELLEEGNKTKITRFTVDHMLSETIEKAWYEIIQERFHNAELPEELREKLRAFLENHKGPLAVRSDSTLEATLQYSFHGAYLTTFAANNRTPKQNLQDLETKIKQVYASTFSPKAKSNRRDLHLRLEQDRMAVILQDLMGDVHHGKYYPDAAGVIHTEYQNPPDEKFKGMQRQAAVCMVFGLGTRVVDGGSSSRLVWLLDPRYRTIPAGETQRHDRSHDDFLHVRRQSQETFDWLDLDTGHVSQKPIMEERNLNPRLRMFCSAHNRDHGSFGPPSVGFDSSRNERWYVTFDELIMGNRRAEYPFLQAIGVMAPYIQGMATVPMDVEFVVRFGKGTMEINIVQCSPLVDLGEEVKVDLSEGESQATLGRSKIAFGHGTKQFKHVIYVPSASYSGIQNKEALANLIGSLNRKLKDGYLLIAPGKVGSRKAPEKGLPVDEEISNAGAIVEFASTSMSPDNSYTSHLFSDFVFRKGGIILPIYPGEKGNLIDLEWLENQENRLPREWVELMQSHGIPADAVRYIALKDEHISVMSDGYTGRIFLMPPQTKPA